MCNNTLFKTFYKQFQNLKDGLPIFLLLIFCIEIFYFESASATSPGRIHVVEGPVTYSKLNQTKIKTLKLRRSTRITRSMIIYLPENSRISFRTLNTCKASVLGPATIITPTKSANEWRVEGPSFHWKCKDHRTEWIKFGKHRVILNQGSIMVHNHVLSILGIDQIVNYQVLPSLNLYCLSKDNWISSGQFKAPPFNHENHTSLIFHSLNCSSELNIPRLMITQAPLQDPLPQLAKPQKRENPPAPAEGNQTKHHLSDFHKAKDVHNLYRSEVAQRTPATPHPKASNSSNLVAPDHKDAVPNRFKPSLSSSNEFFLRTKRDVTSLVYNNLLVASAFDSRKILSKSGFSTGLMARHIQDVSLKGTNGSSSFALEAFAEYRVYYLISGGIRTVISENFKQYGPSLRVDLTNPASYYNLGAKQRPFNYSLHGDLLFHSSMEKGTSDNNFFVFRAGFTVDYFPTNHSFYLFGNILGIIKQKDVEGSLAIGLGYEY